MLQIILRTILIYFFILLIMKFMGKREIGQLSLFDLVVLLLIADISIMAIPEDKKAFYFYLIAIIIISLIQKLLAKLSLKLPKLRKIFDGKESIIILNGKLNIKEMKKQSYSMDDLLVQTRLKNITCLKEIKHLILETNGEISIFTYKKNNLGIPSESNKESLINNDPSNPYDVDPFPVIVSGKIKSDNIKITNTKIDKLLKDIDSKGLKVSDIYYAHYIKGKLFIMQTLD